MFVSCLLLPEKNNRAVRCFVVVIAVVFGLSRTRVFDPHKFGNSDFSDAFTRA